MILQGTFTVGPIAVTNDGLKHFTLTRVPGTPTVPALPANDSVLNLEVAIDAAADLTGFVVGVEVDGQVIDR